MNAATIRPAGVQSEGRAPSRFQDPRQADPGGKIRGSVKALAVTGDTRSSALPDVPTFKEAGVPEFDLASWTVMLAPKGTPADIVALIRKETLAAIGDPKTSAKVRFKKAVLAPDMIALTGDIVDGSVAALADHPSGNLFPVGMTTVTVTRSASSSPVVRLIAALLLISASPAPRKRSRAGSRSRPARSR